MSAGPRAGQTRAKVREAKTCCHSTQAAEGGRDESVQKPASPNYLLHILDTAIGQGDAGHPHRAPVAVGAFAIKLGPGRLKDITALGAQELPEDGDHSSTITPVRVFLVLLSKPRGEKGTV